MSAYLPTVLCPIARTKAVMCVRSAAPRVEVVFAAYFHSVSNHGFAQSSPGMFVPSVRWKSAELSLGAGPAACI